MLSIVCVMYYVYLEVVECSLTTCGLVWKHASNDVFEHFGWRSTVEWTSGWFCQMSLAEIFHDLELVSVKVS